MILDPYGREIASLPKRPDPDMLGTVRIRDQWSSYPGNGLTPEKLASILREADAGDILRQVELAEEMEERDPDLSSVLHTRKLAVQGSDWEILAASDSPEDEEIAAFCKKQLEDLDLEEPTLDLLDAVFKGFACQEIQWDISEGQARVHKLERIPQHRFTFLHLGHFDDPLPPVPNLLTIDAPIYGIQPPPFKLLYHRHKARSGLTQRGGLFRPIAFFYLFKNYGFKDWLIFLEKYGQPTRIGKYTNAAGPKEIQVLHQAVQSLGADAAAVIADSTLIELLESKNTGASSGVYDTFTDRIDKSYAKAILGQTATTEGTPGALGNETARAMVRQDIKAADGRALAKTYREQLLWPLVGFNFGWDKAVPHFRYQAKEEKNLAALAQTHKHLIEMGMKIPLSYVHKIYSIPEPKPGEEVLSAPSRQEPPPLPQEDEAPAFLRSLMLKKKAPIGARLVPLSLQESA